MLYLAATGAEPGSELEGEGRAPAVMPKPACPCPAGTPPPEREERHQARRRVLRLALPAVGEMTLHTFVWIVDMAMVGRLGADALSAVGLGGSVYFSLGFCLGALGIGTTATVAHHWGAGNRARAGEATGRAVLLALLAGALLTTTMLLFAPAIYGLSDLSPAVRRTGSLYLRTVGAGGLFIILQHVCCGAMRGAGDTRTPLLVAGLANVINAAGDYVLIFGHLGLPACGAQGAALAALAAQTVGGVLALTWLLSRRGPFRLTLSAIRFEAVVSRRLLSLSAPAGLENILMDGARVINWFFITVLGSTAFAAGQVALAAESLAFMPAYGFAMAATVVAGQRLGSGEPDRARLEVGQALWLGTAFSSIVALCFLAVPQAIVGLFTGAPGVCALAAACLWIAAFEQPLMIGSEVLLGAMRGAGATRTAMLITAATVWGVRVPLTFYLIYCRHFPLTAAWWVMLLEWACRTAITGAVYLKGGWMRSRICGRADDEERENQTARQ